MKRILLVLAGGLVSVSVWAKRPVTPAGPSRPVTSVVLTRPQTTDSVVHAQTTVEVSHPTTGAVAYPRTSAVTVRPSTDVSVTHPQTMSSAHYAQTTVVVSHPVTEVSVFHPQTPGEKSVAQVSQGRIFSQQGDRIPSSQAPTSMSGFTPKPAKDFQLSSQEADSSLALGNDTSAEADKNALAASHLRGDARDAVEKADLTKNSDALSGLDKMLIDRTKVQQKK